MLIVQTITIILLAFVIFYLVLYNNSLKLEKRIGKYSIESIKDKPVSFFDFLINTYTKLIRSTSIALKKSAVMNNYSKKYGKYISYDNEKDVIAMDYVSTKLFISIIFIFITLFARVIEGKLPNGLDILLAGLFGFFLIDIYFLFNNYFKKKRIEQELLNAIIIMNNAFRSGRSTMQAIEIVATELTGPIKEEFKKMHLEISYGLSLDTVFERFSKRVDLEEVNYITSSLTILNKTGGNIIKVFSSIEKMLFNKRKLKEEMKSLTSSSKTLSITLLVLPAIFIFVISVISSGYGILEFIKNPFLIFLTFSKGFFSPLFMYPIGNAILVLIIAVYVLYIFIVMKIMKVRFS